MRWILRQRATPRSPLVSSRGLLGVLIMGVLTACQEPGLGGQEGEPSSPGTSDGGTGGPGGSDGGGSDGGSTDGGGPGGGTTGGTDGGTTGGTDGGTTGGADTGGGTDGGDTAGPGDTADTADTGMEEECDDVSEVTLYLSPDDSNSMSSPVQVREAVLDDWASISRVPIRTYEFMNYYSFDYTAAEAGTLRVQLDMVQEEGAEDGQYTMQIGVSSPAVSSEDREPMNITLVLDESGSMSGEPMDLLKASCRAIAGSLKSGDVVSMVTWDTSNATVLDSHAVSGPDDSVLISAINSISAGGGTDLHGGLSAGYALAQKNYSADRINRLVLISDGGANAGVTDIDLIAAAAGGAGEDGIYLVGVGVGTAATYNDALMDEVTDAGKGASVFIPSEAEAERIFGERFVEVMDVAARDVQVRLDLPPGFEIVRFSGEEYSADPAEVEPQNIAPSDAMVFYQTVETCAPELLSDETPIAVTARYLDPVTSAESEVSQTLTMAELAGADTALLRKGAAVYRYAEALKAYKAAASTAEQAEIIGEALSVLEQAELENPGDSDLAEIRTVLEAL